MPLTFQTQIPKMNESIPPIVQTKYVQAELSGRQATLQADQNEPIPDEKHSSPDNFNEDIDSPDEIIILDDLTWSSVQPRYSPSKSKLNPEAPSFEPISPVDAWGTLKQESKLFPGGMNTFEVCNHLQFEANVFLEFSHKHRVFLTLRGYLCLFICPRPYRTALCCHIDNGCIRPSYCGFNSSFNGCSQSNRVSPCNNSIDGLFTT